MYNVNNSGAGDDMINEKDTGALINQIREISRDHIDWIKTQLLKPNNFMVAKGREVWIDVPNSKLKNIVTIPSKNEPNYREAWIRVYNLAVDYLEGSLSYACMKGDLDYRTIQWPDFDSSNANYVRGLEKVLDAYKLELDKKRKEEEQKSRLMVTKSSVMLSPIDSEAFDSAYKREVEDAALLNVSPRAVRVQAKNAKPELEYVASKSLENSAPLEKSIQNLEIESIEPVREEEYVGEKFVAQKILDGDKLTKKDLRDLHDNGADLVVLPCQDVDNIKEEKLFLENMRVCSNDYIRTGVMIYGHATEEREAAYELKKIFKLLDQCGYGFTRWIIYEVNDKFVLKNKDSEMKLLSFINAYTMIAEGLAKDGFIPVISMNVTSKKILSDIYNRYNLESKFEIIYTVLVRELDDLSKNDSTILMDPQYDYDIVTLRNPKFKNAETLKSVLNNLDVQNTTLAKVA